MLVGRCLSYGEGITYWPLAEAAKTAVEHSPCAIVVTEEVYSNERLGLDRLALEAGAQLIVSSEDFELSLIHISEPTRRS